MAAAHDPSSKLTQFLKEVKLLLPNSHRESRRQHRRADRRDLPLRRLHRPRHRRTAACPTARRAHARADGLLGLHNVVMRHDIPKVAPVSEAFPHLIFHNLTTKIGRRVGSILKHLFPVPKAESKRVCSFVNRDDFISFRHHVYTREKAAVHLMEAGPRFEMRLYQIKLGTIDMTEVDNEWVLRPYQNSAKRRRLMGDAEDDREA